MKPPVGAQINWGNPIARGLISCWLINEGGGLTNVDSVANRTLTRAVGSAWKMTANGPALSFNGTANDESNTVSSSLYATGTNDMTVEAIIFPTASATQAIAAYDDTTATWEWYLAGLTPNFFDMTNSHFGAVSGALTLNTKNDVLVVRSASAMTGYLNGAIGVTVNAMGTWSASQRLTLGNRVADGALPFNGYISLFRIWNRALSSAEIAQLYQDPYAMFIPSSPSSWWMTAVSQGAVAATTPAIGGLILQGGKMTIQGGKVTVW